MNDLKNKIESSLALSVCRGWDRQFLESILTQLDRGRDLSHKQKETLFKVLARNNEAAELLHQNWETEYRDSHQDAAKVVAAYYATTQYYVAMSREILQDKIPERLSFMRMMENKYAQKVLNEYSKPPRFEAGSHVTGRSLLDLSRAEFDEIDWVTRRDTFGKFMKNGGFILDICPVILSSAKGAKRYKILPIGAAVPIVVEERFLKRKRN